MSKTEERNRILVSSTANVGNLKYSIKSALRKNPKNVALSCIGAASLNQATKAIAAINQEYQESPESIRVLTLTTFETTDIEGSKVSSLLLALIVV